MIGRLFTDRRTRSIVRRVDRPEAIGLAVVQTIVAVVGWLIDPDVWLAAVIGVQLTVGGLGAVRVIGPAQAGMGFARYAIPATAGVATTLVGRLAPGGIVVLFAPLTVVLLWTVLYLELRAARLEGGRTIQDLLLTVILFAGGAGIFGLLGAAVWPPSIGLVAVVALVVALRSAEARGLGGAEAFGQALLHVLAVVQVGAAVVLLDLPGLVGPAIMALAFYAWGGAAEALRGGMSGRAVALEFGALAVLGLLVTLIVRQA